MGGDRRALKAMSTIAIFFALLAAVGLAGVDRIVAAEVVPGAGSVWARGVALVDLGMLRSIGIWLLPIIFVWAALILLVLRATRGIGFPLLYLGFVHLFAFGAADLAGPRLGRVGPAEAASGSDLWFASGNSFPSATAAFYAGFFFPLVLLFPRLWPLWVAPPLLVSASLVLTEGHYLSDVTASLALAATLAAALSFVAEKGRE